jgi:putative ABC transport system permease protein
MTQQRQHLAEGPRISGTRFGYQRRRRGWVLALAVVVVVVAGLGGAVAAGVFRSAAPAVSNSGYSTGTAAVTRGSLTDQADPQNPSAADVSQPSNALVAQADAKAAFSTLFLGLGAVALLVGAIGVANIMVIAVLERRSEIGLRRALGATRGHIRTQFLAEAIALSLIGGAAGIIAGIAATAIYAHGRGWATVIPTDAWAGGLAAAILIGALAGLLPAIRAARLSPTEALWSL